MQRFVSIASRRLWRSIEMAIRLHRRLRRASPERALRAKAGCVFAAASIAASAAAAPLRLAIYYGYPSLVEQSGGDTARAAAVFGQYDAIVFGDGLELPDAEAADAGLKAERQRIAPLIRAIHDTPRGH